MERCALIRVESVRVGARIDEHPCDLDVSVDGGVMKGEILPLVVRIGSVRLRRGGAQDAGDLGGVSGDDGLVDIGGKCGEGEGEESKGQNEGWSERGVIHFLFLLRDRRRTCVSRRDTRLVGPMRNA